MIFNRVVFLLILIFCLSPWGSGAIALALGLGLSLTIKNPFITYTKKYTSQLLQYSVVGLGAGMNLKVIAAVGIAGIGYTVMGISFAFLIGFLLTKFLKTNFYVSTLITAGTAICGGSAIAAIAPVINASEEDISVSLAAVFILNAVALFIFPPIGHFLSMTQHQFGLWSALAIHDTSSVVGAGLSYGAEALSVATTIKLARALWIIPVSFFIAIYMSKQMTQTSSKKAKRPWFILGFLFMAALVTWIPQAQSSGLLISSIAKKFLVVTLFFIGSGLSIESLKIVGAKPLVLAFSLWVIVASTTLLAIKLNLIY